MIKKIDVICRVLFGILFINLLVKDINAQDWLSVWRDATVAIGIIRTANVLDPVTSKPIKDKSGKEIETKYFKVIGTGVICASPEGKDTAVYLLTAKHVFDEPKKNWHPKNVRIRFSWFDKYSVTDNLGVKLKLRDKRDNPIWIEHKNKNVDLALIKFTVSIKEAQREKVNPIRITDTATDNEIFQGAAIQVFGYPGAIGPTYWTRALVRNGIIAWVSPNKSSYIPLLIDSMIFPGNSGGPVFRVPTGLNKDGAFTIGGRASFVGIVSGVQMQPMGLEYPDKKTSIIISDKEKKDIKSLDNMGLAVIVPAEKVKELLNQLLK